jgi:hypothetical protein
MPRKTKQKQKQKQQQIQKVVVNVGVREKNKNKSKKRRRRARQDGAIGGAAREYSEALSQIIPRIQYNFPQHSSFNYDRDTKDYGVNQQEIRGGTRRPLPVDSSEPIPITAPIRLYQRTDFPQQIAADLKSQREIENSNVGLREFASKADPINELLMESARPMTGMDTMPIKSIDRYDPIYEDLTEPTTRTRVRAFSSASTISESVMQQPSGPPPVGMKIAKYKRPAQSTLEALLVSQGKEVTGDNLYEAETAYRKMRDEGLSSAEILKMVRPKSVKKRGIKIPATSAAEDTSDEGSIVMAKKTKKPVAKSAAKGALASVGAAIFDTTLSAPAASVAKAAGKVGLDTLFS